MRASSIWNGLVSALRMSAVGIGVVLYVTSFLGYGWDTSLFGYGWDTGGNLLIAAFGFVFLTSIPTMIRDRRFFLKYWGIGLTPLRSHPPCQFFPARREKHLNALAWYMFALIPLHFLWLAAKGPGRSEEPIAVLRCVSLLVSCSAIINVLRWDYPPTMKPGNSGRAQ